ncbi:hypothetical protein M1M85_02510 [Nitrospinaceae bacterium]|nr:hypothetical protein [Nitrospinaceae bacterium]
MSSQSKYAEHRDVTKGYIGRLIKEWEEWNASSKDRHAKGRAKAKKHKPKK